MKHLFFTIISLLLATSFGFSQDGEIILDTIKSSSNSGEKVYIKVDTKPDFEGGIQAFYEYIKKNLKIPEVEKDVKGNVIVSFIVEKDGSLSNIKILRDPVGMEKEVTEMLTACPKWKPGIQDGKPVRVEYTLPIAVNIKAKK